MTSIYRFCTVAFRTRDRSRVTSKMAPPLFPGGTATHPVVQGTVGRAYAAARPCVRCLSRALVPQRRLGTREKMDIVCGRVPWNGTLSMEWQAGLEWQAGMLNPGGQ